jgi:dihydroorotate dehydrogenase electron transfer subunit
MEKKGVQTYLFYGAQHAKNIVKQSYSEKVTVMYSTDDGSYGFGGFVTDLLEQKTDLFPGGSVVSACGPLVMMRQVWKLAREHLWLCHVSLEQFMACGVGACNGCVVDCKAAGDKVVRKRVCKDGPVFKAEELVWK